MAVTGVPIAPSTFTLDAVNEMLEAINEAPVSALDAGGTTIEAQAETTLDRNRRNILEEGHFENREKNITLTPVADEITIDADVLRLDSTRGSASLNVTIRDGKLFNVGEQTSTFTADVQVDIIRLLSFDNCSEKMRQRITREAKLEFQRRIRGSRDQDSFLRQELGDVRTKLQRSEQESADVNMLEGTFERQIVGRRNTRIAKR